MKALQTPTVRIVIYEGAGAAALDAGSRFELTRTLLNAGYTVTCTGGANTMAPGVVAPVGESTLIVLGRFASTPDVEDVEGRIQIQLRDITGMTAAQVQAVVEKTLADLSLEVNKPGRWKPWFPVIDYDRCTNCMQCLSFCLFDVYGVSQAGKIQVQNNDNCKTDCPACSRVCPEVAILFPKYTAGPINGDVVRGGDVKREAMKIDISALLGGDIYSTLKQRHEQAKERFAKERDDKRALAERMKCMVKLQDSLDIPMNVLKNLPSRDEILRKAEAAKAKAQTALDAQPGH
jgi:Pyruvate/2-oxoacid:ferredoxin oxidoreductase delta subunit